MNILLLKYGYLLLFAGVFVEGEAFLLAGVFLASRGYFNMDKVVLTSLAANTLASQFYYFAARIRGQRWFERRFAGNANYRRVLTWMHGYGNAVLLFSRYAFGFRIVIPVACGALGMPQTNFFLLNLAAGILWVIPLSLLGYYFGNSAAMVVQHAHRYMIGGMALAVLAIAVAISIRHSRRVIGMFQDLEWSGLHALIPFFMGFIGLLNLVSALGRRPEAALPPIERWLPLEVTQESRVLMLFAGVALLQLTRSLARRKETAWYASVIVLSASFILHITSTLDLQHSMVTGLLLAYLIYFRRRFNARSDALSMRRALIIAPILAVVVLFYGWTGFYAERAHFHWMPGATAVEEAFRSGILIVAPHVAPLTRGANRMLSSIQIAGWIARVYVLILILRPVVLRHRLIVAPPEVARIFSAYGDEPASAYAIQEDKHELLVAGGRALIAYAAKGAVAIACGDPMASAGDFEVAVKEYTDHCVRHGWTPTIYLAHAERLPVYHSLGFASQPVAEDAIVNLDRWKPEPPERYGLEEMSVRRYDRAEAIDPYLDEQLEEVTEDWLETRHIGEMGFTIGHFSLESLSEGPVFVLVRGPRVEAFCGWLPYRKGSGMVMDLMRQRHTAPANTAEILLTGTLQMLQQAGVHEACLSTMPLRHSDKLITPVDRFLVGEFNPRWEERHIVYPRGASLARIESVLAAVQFGRFRAAGLFKPEVA